MRLGVVGMTPADFREINGGHLAAIGELGLSGVGFHAGAELIREVDEAACAGVRQTFDQAGMDLVQFGIGYRECLFHPNPAHRELVLQSVERGIQVSRMLGAEFCLIRTGSLSPRGSYSPDRANMTPESRARLLDTLSRIATVAEAAGQTMVIETHLLTIMDSPETNREILVELGSPRMTVVMDYVNHFPTLPHVFASTARLNHIFDVMGPVSGVGHCKDIRIGDGLVLHIDEAIPGEGELDLATALQRWHGLYPNGYMLLEHLPNADYPQASRNTHRIAQQAGVPIF